MRHFLSNDKHSSTINKPMVKDNAPDYHGHLHRHMTNTISMLPIRRQYHSPFSNIWIPSVYNRSTGNRPITKRVQQGPLPDSTMVRPTEAPQDVLRPQQKRSIMEPTSFQVSKRHQPNHVSPNLSPLSRSDFAALPPGQQRQVMVEHLRRAIYPIYPDLAVF